MSTSLLKLCDYYDINALLITALRGFSASQCALKYVDVNLYLYASTFFSRMFYAYNYLIS